jgi:hypothetical protein
VFYKGVTYHNLQHASTKLGIDKEELRAEILDLKKPDSYFIAERDDANAGKTFKEMADESREKVRKILERQFIKSVTQSTVKGKYEAFIAANKTVVVDSAAGSLFLDPPMEEEIQRVIVVTFTDTVFPVEGDREKMQVLVHVSDYVENALVHFVAMTGRQGSTVSLTRGRLSDDLPNLPPIIASALNSYFGLVNVISIDYRS